MAVVENKKRAISVLLLRFCEFELCPLFLKRRLWFVWGFSLSDICLPFFSSLYSFLLLFFFFQSFSFFFLFFLLWG